MHGKPHIIGISGPSCSGKTVLSCRLGEILQSVILPLDAYYRDLADLDWETRTRCNFDVPEALEWELIADHMQKLAAGQQIERPVYDFSTHTRAPQSQTVTPGPFVILEGLFVLYSEQVRALLDTKVFVFACDDVCLSRRLARDCAERGRTRVSVLDQYSGTVRPMSEKYVLPTRRFADLIVSGERPVADSVAAVLTRLGRFPGE